MLHDAPHLYTAIASRFKLQLILFTTTLIGAQDIRYTAATFTAYGRQPQFITTPRHAGLLKRDD